MHAPVRRVSDRSPRTQCGRGQLELGRMHAPVRRGRGQSTRTQCGQGQLELERLHAPVQRGSGQSPRTQFWQGQMELERLHPPVQQVSGRGPRTQRRRDTIRQRPATTNCWTLCVISGKLSLNDRRRLKESLVRVRAPAFLRVEVGAKPVDEQTAVKSFVPDS